MQQGTAVAADGLIGTAYPVTRDRTTPNFRDGYMYVSPRGMLCFYVNSERGDDLHFRYARKDGTFPESPFAEGFTLRRTLAHLMRVAG
jgi:hypothetical protein